MPLKFYEETGLDDVKDRLALRIKVEQAKLDRFNFSKRTREQIEARIALLKNKLASL